MSGEIVMPRLSDSMEEGTIVRWIKSVGDRIEVGEDLVEIETDKANMVYASDLAGTLTQILVAENETRPIGTPIALVDSDGQTAKGSETTSEQPVEAPPAPEPAEAPAKQAPEASAAEDHDRQLASPIARRMARQLGIDLEELSGSGPNGRIVKRDVELAAEGAGGAEATTQPPPIESSARGEQTEVELSRLQETIVRRMTQAKATIPHFHLTAEVDMTAAVEARRHLKEIEAERVPSVNDLIIRACALALHEMPKLNGSYRDGKLILNSRINVGLAVASEDALVVPTVFDADRKDLREIAIETTALAAKVRDQTITPPELSGGTFTVSNLGMYGVTSFEAVINPPQSAILAVGAIVERLVPAKGDAGGTAKIMEITLGCDHRVIYGADGARFIARVKELLEDPLALAL